MKPSGSWANNWLQVNISCVEVPWIVRIIDVNISGTMIARKQVSANIYKLQEWIACIDSSGMSKGMQFQCGTIRRECVCQIIVNGLVSLSKCK